MSTLEMAINLLQEMPEQAVETVYVFMQSIHTQQKAVQNQLLRLA